MAESASSDYLDTLLLSEAAYQWRKMARIVGRAMIAAEKAGFP
jgi:hypothetical protein